ncbi:DUF3987 domain-containing protein|uniref:DUF3987 domain-containing protein n=1 Tax=Pseudomonas sp. SbOxS1 TaxID=2723884 RepID=UPI0015D36298|nr:DUF3987 domain-containing protein [Pseudomonas sp. SbOxS1]NYU05753.1 DUF3987 domain-containing protein [Pseudomonas sp. SbOxS1]
MDIEEKPPTGSDSGDGYEATSMQGHDSAETDSPQSLADLYEVAEQPIFVPYKLVPKKNGKTDKVPNNGQHNLRYTEPSHRMPLVDALKRVNEWRGLHGIGLVFEGGIIRDGFQLVGLDYDDVDFDHFHLPVASYAERSPSLKGIHQLAWVPTAWAAQYRYTGNIQIADCHHAEVYLASRFLTTSGDRINDLPIKRLTSDELLILESWKLNPFEKAPAFAAAPEIPDGGSLIDLTRFALSPTQKQLLGGAKRPEIDRSTVSHGLWIKLFDEGCKREDILYTTIKAPALWQYCLDHRNDDPGKALEFAKEEINRAYGISQSGMRAKLVGFNPTWKPAEPKEIITFPAPYPGPMADAVAAGLEAAHKRQPELTTMGVLSSMAASCGSFYRQQNGSRLNLYFLGIAKTGTGKDVPLRLAKQIGRLGNAKLIGAPGSGQGLEDALVSNIATYCAVDEIAHFFSAMNDAKASNYERANGRKLLELFSASGDEYETRALAGKEARIVQNPAFNLIGFTTPEKLGTAFNPDDFADGLAGRILFVFTNNNPPARRVRKPIELPVSVKRTAMQVENGLVYLQSMGGIVINISDDAEGMLDVLLAEFDRRGRAVDSPWESALCVRSLEKVERIAGVLAVWDNPAKPVISLGHVEWAAQFVRASNAAVLSFVEEFMHSGDEQKNAAALMGMLLDGKTKPKPDRKGEIAASDAGWVPRSALMRRSDLCKKDFDAAIAYLMARDEIESGLFGDKRMQVVGLKSDD